ncbi:MAG: hypothetical protein V7646_2276 [Pseudonocardia sp.]
MVAVVGRYQEIDYLGHQRVSMTQDVYMSRKSTGASRSRVGAVHFTDVTGVVRGSADGTRGRASAVGTRFLCEVHVQLAVVLGSQPTRRVPTAHGVDVGPGRQEAGVAVSRQSRVCAGAVVQGAQRA